MKSLQPLSILMPSRGSQEEVLLRSCLAAHHYLGFGKTVGENPGYLVRDRQGRDLACLLFGSAAWRVRDRDRFIGWADETRIKQPPTSFMRRKQKEGAVRIGNKHSRA